MFLSYLLVISSVLIIDSQSLPANNTPIISTYAKVAHWGPSTTQPLSEGRSHHGQTLWTHRSDVNIASGQKLKPKPKPKVTYLYAQSKTGSGPGVGEVQERFNPRPYFDYAPIPPKPAQNTKPKTPAPPPTFDSFPVFKQPSYNSPYSSYNPPSLPVSDDSKPDAAYPPNVPAPPDDTPEDTPAPAPQPSPVGPQDDQDPYHGNPDDNGQLFYPPGDNGQETILDHPPPGWEENKNGGDSGDSPPPPPEEPPKGHDMAEGDLSPPPSGDNHFPPYLYNGHGNNFDYDFDHHHVYKEVTTTTEAPEDERVNKGHYSYHYLGRKLWYIPLYFSAYFIIYVTVLILKAIARHKIQFKHDYLQKGVGKDMGKDMMDHQRSYKIDEIHRNVQAGIENTRKRFPFVAM